MDKIILCLTGGTTGGHFFPLLNVAKEFKKIMEEKRWDYEIFYLGAEPFDRELMQKYDIQIITIPSAKIRRYFDLRNFLDIFKFPMGFLKALWILYLKMPNVIFSKGGYGTLEVVLAGWFLRIPILIHESDAIPGRSNRIAGFFATRIAVSFEKAKKYFSKKKTALIGHPIDPDFDSINPDEEIFKKFNLETDKPIILVLGGSQGAMKINEVIIFSLDKLLMFSQVIHQLGKSLFKEYKQIAEGFILEKVPVRIKYYHPIDFIEHNDLIKLLKISDLVISRAGAGAIFEIAAAGVPSILIPLRKDVAGKHQIENAYEYAHTGAAVVIEEPNFTPDILSSVVHKILNDKATLEFMKKSALEFAKKEATKIIAEELSFLAIKE